MATSFLPDPDRGGDARGEHVAARGAGHAPGAGEAPGPTGAADAAGETDAPGALDVAATIAEVVRTRREIAALQAREAALLARLVDHARAQPDPNGHELPLRDVSARVGAAVRAADRTVRDQLGTAWSLVARFPATWRALAEGRIGMAHARVLADAGANIADDAARAAFEARALPVAERETPGRTRGLARRLAQRAQPESIRERHRRAREARCVSVSDLDDGMSVLTAILPSVLAHGIHDRLTTMAASVKARRRASGVDGARTKADGASAPETPYGGDRLPVDARLTDALRADLLADLLLTGTPSGHGDGLDAVRAEVQITVPVLTLLGRDDVATLAGTGPIDPDTAARLTASAPGWDRILTHPIAGTVVEVDRYRPSEEMRRHLRARDQRCRFPTCNRDASRCDIDHTVDAARGGPTAKTNLAHLCEAHHVLKHATAWSVGQSPGGILEWTSPTGERYTDSPPPPVTFTIDDPAPF